MYGYKEDMERGVEPEGVWEDSPTCLVFYRGLYDEMMVKYRAEGSDFDVNFCRLSLLTDNIAIAADDPSCRSAILRKIVAEIWTTAGEDGACEFDDLVIKMAEDKDKVDDTVRETLKRGFSILLSKEGL